MSELIVGLVALVSGFSLGVSCGSVWRGNYWADKARNGTTVVHAGQRYRVLPEDEFWRLERGLKGR